MSANNAYILFLNILKISLAALSSMIIVVGVLSWLQLVGSFFFDVSDFIPDRGYLYFGYASIILSGVVFLIGCGFGEWFFRLFFNMRKPTLREEERINPLIEEIEKDYFSKYNEKLDVKYYIVDAQFLNGFAFGFSTIAIHRGALEELTDDELQALIAHEIGHIHYKDGGYNSIQLGLSMFSLSLVKIPMSIQGSVFGAVDNSKTKDERDGSMILSLIILVVFFPITIAIIITFPIIWIARIIDRMGLWHIEYRADRFAYDMGFGEGLISFFEKMLPLDERNRHGFLSKYGYSHPPTAARIDKIERL